MCVCVCVCVWSGCRWTRCGTRCGMVVSMATNGLSDSGVCVCVARL